MKIKPSFGLVFFALWCGFFWGAVVAEVGMIPWMIGMIVLSIAFILSVIWPYDSDASN